MRIIGLILAGWMAVAAAGPVWAQSADMERRIVLARELIAVSSGPNLAKSIERYAQSEIEKAAQGQDTEEAAWIRANMPAMIGRMISRMMTDLEPVYAETFTVAELEAQIAFYRSPVGQDIAAKSMEIGMRQEAVMQTALMGLLTEFQSKFCAAFDCGADAGQAAAKRGR